MSVKSVINPLETTGVIFGPFENARGAELMAASEINDEGKDFLALDGVHLRENDEIDFQKPLLERARVFVCTDDECKQFKVQRIMFCLQSERKNLGSDTGSKRLGGGATMKLNTIETGRKRHLLVLEHFSSGWDSSWNQTAQPQWSSV